MVDPNKTIRMTELAKIESGITGKQLKIASCRKQEYLLRQMLLSFLAGSMCYASLVIIWTIGMWEKMGLLLGDSDVIGGIFFLIPGYVIFVAAYLCLTWVISVRKYKHACTVRDDYRAALDSLLHTDRGES